MKKKFALLLLPALMALSSCGAAAQPAPEKTFLEDTTAQSEIFGGNDVVGGDLQVKNRAKGEAISVPKIGYQIQYKSEGDKLAIRFVAAIKEFNVKAYWRRGVAGPDGNELRSKSFANTGREVTKYYTSLSDGNTTITAGSGDYEDYAGFVVYSIYNIPYTENKNVYVAAYVNLIGDEDGDSEVQSNSKALAVKIEKKTNYESNNVFAFNATMTDMHFLEGTINGTVFDGGTNGLYERSDPSRKGNNNAWYENITLKAGDSFGSFYYDHDRIFQYFGYTVYFDSTSDFDESTLSGFASPKKEGKYNLYISKDNANHVYSSRLAYHITFNFNATTIETMSWGEDPTPSGFFIHAYNGATAYSGAWGAGTMAPVPGQEHIYTYSLEMTVGTSIANTIVGFNQGGAGKQTIALTSAASDTATFTINSDGSWTNGEMNATISGS